MAIEKSYIDMLKERDAIIVTLKELLKLSYEKLGSQSDMITKLDKELSRIVSGLFSENELVIRDLEQRANGIMDVRKANVRKKRTLGSMWGGGHIIHNMQLAEEELRNQAKALKEQE
jgi:hypothetical protein